MADFNGGSIPVWKFEGNDKSYTQSASILRMLGLKYGYLPTDPEEHHTVDTVLEAIVDFNTTKCLYALMSEDGPTEEQIKLAVDSCHKLYVYLESMLANHGKEFLAGDKITIADFAAGSLMYTTALNKCVKSQAFTDALHADFVTFPHCVKYAEMMGTLFADWLATRNASPL